jgi:hypothetical protein
MVSQGWIQPSKSEWCSPVLFLKKPNGGWRFLVDLRGVNARTKPISYYMPDMHGPLSVCAHAPGRLRACTRMGASVQHLRGCAGCAAASTLPCSRAQALAPNATRDTRGGCFCREGVPPAAADSESSLSSELQHPAFVSRSDTVH